MGLPATLGRGTIPLCTRRLDVDRGRATSSALDAPFMVMHRHERFFWIGSGPLGRCRSFSAGGNDALLSSQSYRRTTPTRD